MTAARAEAMSLAALLLLLFGAAPARAVNIVFLDESSAPAKVPYWPEGLRASLATQGYFKGFSGDRSRAAGLVNQPLTQDDLSVRFQRKTAEGLDIQQEFSGRYTNDRALSPNKDFLIQNAFFSAERANQFAARAGNILANFSRYTLGSSLQGLNGYYQKNGWRVSSVLASREGEDGVRFRRWTSGARLESQSPRRLPSFLKGATAGVSVVSTNDDAKSIANQTNVQKVNALVYGADSRLDFKRNVSLALEGAGSDFRSNQGARLLGSAVNADLDWRPGRFTSGLAFEQQDPLFRSPAGSAAPDQRRLAPRAAFRAAPWAGLDAAAEFTRNNLNHQLAATTLDETYNLGLSARPLGWRPNHPLAGLNVNLGTRLNRQRTTDLSSKRQTLSYDAAASHGLAGWNWTAGYSLQLDKDLVNEANNRVVQSPKLGLGYRWTIDPAWNLTLNPSLNASYTRDTQVSTGLPTRTKIYDLLLGGTVDGCAFTLGLGTTSAQRPAPANASFQRRFRLDLRQTLRPGLTFTAGLSLSHNTESDATRNYDDNEGNFGLRYEF